MEGADAAGARGRVGETRHRLLELAERRRWAHHVGHLATGEVVSAELERPPTPLATARRLDAAGVWPRTCPTGPSFLLTPRSPWLQSGAAYLSIYNPSTYRPFDDTVGWEVPADHDGSPLLGLDAYFTAFPADAAVLSIDIAARAWAGRTGSVAVSSQFPAQASIPIDGQFRAHTIHLAVHASAQPGPRLVDAVVVIGPGVELLTFRALALGVGFLLEGVMLDPAVP